jgi:adenosine 3'-phospho 5'-phosphosulfate transporter B3
MCGWIETLITRNNQRHGALKDYATVSLLAMGGAYLTNWALNYLNYTTRIVFKSCRVLPVMAFRTIVVGQRYGPQQYCAGLLLVCGIALFTMGDAEGMPNFSGIGIGLISVALVRERVSPLPDSQRLRAPLESTPVLSTSLQVCDALTANLEEKQFFRIKQPCSHAEVMLYLSTFAAAESFFVLVASGGGTSEDAINAMHHSSLKSTSPHDS